MKRVRIKRVTRHLRGAGFSIHAGPYVKALPFTTERAREYSTKWLEGQSWFEEIRTFRPQDIEEWRELLVGRYLLVRQVRRIQDTSGPYAGTYRLSID